MKSGVRFGFTAAAVLLVAATASPQVAEKKVITLEGAKKAAGAAAEEARRRGVNVVIAVVDDGGELVYLERLDNTQVGSIKVGMGKARTAAHFKRPTKEFEDQTKNGQLVMLALSDFTPLEGGVPIFSNGQFVGAIGVSGDTPQVDAAIALAGAAAIH